MFSPTLIDTNLKFRRFAFQPLGRESKLQQQDVSYHILWKLTRK